MCNCELCITCEVNDDNTCLTARVIQVSQYQNVIILDFIAARMMEVVVTTGAVRLAKLQSNRHHQHPAFFTGQMPFLSSNQQCHSTEGSACEKK